MPRGPSNADFFCHLHPFWTPRIVLSPQSLVSCVTTSKEHPAPGRAESSKTLRQRKVRRTTRRQRCYAGLPAPSSGQTHGRFGPFSTPQLPVGQKNGHCGRQNDKTSDLVEARALPSGPLGLDWPYLRAVSPEISENSANAPRTGKHCVLFCHFRPLWAPGFFCAPWAPISHSLMEKLPPARRGG